MLIGELLWCLEILFFKKVDCEWASVGFIGVFDTQGAASIPENLGGIEVHNLTSSFEMMDSVSKETIHAPRKPA
jgi:hypothetical protein